MFIQIWELIQPDRPLTFSVVILLLLASVFSWAVAFSKWGRIGRLRETDLRFLRAFRKASGLEQLAIASEQFKGAPLVTVFEYGYAEMHRQLQAKGVVFNKTAVERSLQLGINDEVGRIEQNLNWLATVATVTPFIGLFGTVWGIIDAFQALSTAGSASLRVVGPGIADALVATALGLAAAVPAAIFYNWFGTKVREMGARLEDFSLEFMNMVERSQER